MKRDCRRKFLHIAVYSKSMVDRQYLNHSAHSLTSGGIPLIVIVGENRILI